MNESLLPVAQWISAFIMLFSVSAIIIVSVSGTLAEKHKSPSINIFADIGALLVSLLNIVPRGTWIAIAFVSFISFVILENHFQPDVSGVVIKLDYVAPLYPDLGEH